MLRTLMRHGHLFNQALPLILHQQRGGVTGLLVLVEKKGEHIVGHNGLASLDPMLLHLAHILEYVPVGSSRRTPDTRSEAAGRAHGTAGWLRCYRGMRISPRRSSGHASEIIILWRNQLMIDSEAAQTAVIQFLYTLRYVDPRRPPLEWYNSGSGIDKIIDTVVNQGNNLTVWDLGLATLRVLLGRAPVRNVVRGRRDLVDYWLDIAVDGADQGWKAWQDEDTTLGTVELPTLCPEGDAHEILTKIVDSSQLLDSIQGKWTAVKVSILPRIFFMRPIDMLVTEVDSSGDLTSLALKFAESGIIEFFIVLLWTEVPVDDAHREH
ncbi:hypothetical protein FRB99_004274 [Tulasnella sp. 403]|nr:hypothetical protein FRB99_004274 [Tulasnella sp. 403]